MKQKFKIQSNTINYDANSDTLTATFDNGNTSHSINIHDLLIIDLSEKNKIAGLEFLDVSELFDFNKIELSSINNLTLNIIYNQEARELLIKINIEFKESIPREIVMQPIKYEQPIIN